MMTCREGEIGRRTTFGSKTRLAFSISAASFALPNESPGFDERCWVLVCGSTGGTNERTIGPGRGEG